jgi:dTDP-4-amino-4,6-dideoxygalactose transaminase
MIIPFETKQRKKFYHLLDRVFDSSFWSEGEMTRTFEENFGAFVGLSARTVANGGAGLLAVLDYIDVKGKDVIVPANTFWATSQAVKKAGGRVIYADNNRSDLCLSFEDMKRRVTKDTRAIIVVHIGGHIAFESDQIAEYCKQNNLYLIEDCAHVHGASWNGRQGGHFGFAGVYSFYATKTMPTGEGGMVVSRDADFISWIEKYRNYGKKVIDGKVLYPVKDGFNYRMSEFVAALGIVQLENLPAILEWKRALAAKYDAIFDNRVMLPEGMISGYYKYIVFGYPQLKEITGQVFGLNDLGYRIEGINLNMENAEWIAANHQCPPIYYGWEHANKSVDELVSLLLGC